MLTSTKLQSQEQPTRENRERKSFDQVNSFIKDLYGNRSFIPLHEPLFDGNEKKYLNEAIDSTFVSSVGKFVTRFEEMMASLAGTGYAIATVNGTAALHIALIIAGVKPTDEVITQSVTFVATANAISYAGGIPVFIDVDTDTMGLSPEKLSAFLEQNAVAGNDGYCRNRKSGRRIKACVPMHTMGFPCRVDEIDKICKRWHITLIEDAAESIGSVYKGKHTGSFGELGIFSFNGNKTITCGGGGVVVTNSEKMAARAKHLTTQAKVPHPWEYVHDDVGYNYRLPNLNAAVACAQIEQLDHIIRVKREIASRYISFFASQHIPFVQEIEDASANYWLNSILLGDSNERDEFLNVTNASGIMTRPLWKLMFNLPMYNTCERDGQENAQWLADRVVNIPSSVAGLTKQVL